MRALSPGKKIPKAVKGTLKLPKNFKGFVDLNGEWEFYWNKLLTPVGFHQNKEITPDTYINVPDVWNDLEIDKQQLPGQGYGTYRLKVNLGREREGFALKILTFSTAAIVYVNGKILSTYGQTGENIENTKPSYRPEVVFIPGKYDELDIIIQVSNFHYTKGGIWQPIFIGEEDALILKRSRSVITEVFFGR